MTRMESAEIDPHKYAQRSFDPVKKNSVEEGELFSTNGAGHP